MSKARELANLGNAYSDGALSNRNILINGNFDVWQRATSSTTSNGYGSADRWSQYTAGVGGATFEQNSDGDMSITVTGSGTGTARVGQIIEFPEKYHGETVTFTAKVKSNSSNARLLVDSNSQWYTETDAHSGSGNWETLSITLTVESSGLTFLRFTVGLDGVQSANVSLSSSDYVIIKECQLERGDTATPFEHRSYGDELARCQRYFYQWVDGAGQTMGTGGYYTSNLFVAQVDHPVPMRAKPTANITSGTDYYRIWSNGSFDDCSLSGGSLNANSTAYQSIFDLQGDVSGTAGHAGRILSLVSAANIYLDAEL